MFKQFLASLKIMARPDLYQKALADTHDEVLQIKLENDLYMQLTKIFCMSSISNEK